MNSLRQTNELNKRLLRGNLIFFYTSLAYNASLFTFRITPVVISISESNCISVGFEPRIHRQTIPL